MSSYFTIVHILVLVMLFILFVLLFVVTLKETKKKIFWGMMFANFLVISTLSIFSMLVIDKYTKKAKIINLEQKRILRNETISFTGRIRNIGNFAIATCKLEIKLVNDPVTSKKLGGSDLFNPTSVLFKNKDAKPSTVRQTFVIAENLRPNELRTFSVSMKYPPYLKKASTHNKLYCR